MATMAHEQDTTTHDQLSVDMTQRHWLRAQTLRSLRWMAIVGQLITIFVTDLVLGYNLPLLPCVLAILCSVCFNIVTAMTMPTNARLSDPIALLWLIYDMLQLALLLALTGGLSNPFSLLFIAPATVAAAALTGSSARFVVGFAILLILILEVIHLPLSHPERGVLELPGTYRLGVGCALLVGVAFIAIYVRRVADEAFGMSQALSATQLALAREQRLSALGTMAAAAAHELGTPLATIALTAREVERSLPKGTDEAEDLGLILQQTARCRDILAQMSQLRKQDMEHIRTAPLLSILEEAAGPHEHTGKRIEYFIDGEIVDDHNIPSPEVERRPEIIHALRNLIQNAVDFADSVVWIEIVDQIERLTVRIQDDGPGFSNDVLNRLGDPFLTTRRGRKAREGGYEGMGLGLFIAKTLLERRGATITFSNQQNDETNLPGALIEITWTPDAMETADSPLNLEATVSRLGNFGW